LTLLLVEVLEVEEGVVELLSLARINSSSFVDRIRSRFRCCR
jgi:hypothetical protein